MYEIVFTRNFKKTIKKSGKNNPELLKRVEKTLRLLRTNIKHQSLRLHKLTGTDCWAVSVNDSYRMKIKIEDKYIFCLKFGTHEEVY